MKTNGHSRPTGGHPRLNESVGQAGGQFDDR